MCGGVAGYVGAQFLGPRIGRFDKDTPVDEFAPHNVGLVCLGTIVLWFGWFGFNGGSALGATGDNQELIQIVCMNTCISAACAGLTAFILKMLVDKVESVAAICNGLLAGLVGITAGCDAANVWWSAGIGIMSGFIYVFFSKWLESTSVNFGLFAMDRTDDPLEAVTVHGACGFWGACASGLVRYFVQGDDISVLTGCVFGTCVIVLWTLVTSYLIFLPLWYLGYLRVDKLVEI